MENVLSAISNPKRKLLTKEEAGHLTSRTICLESQVYALLWLHDSHPNIFKYSNIYIYVCTQAQIDINIKRLSFNPARPLYEYEKNQLLHDQP